MTSSHLNQDHYDIWSSTYDKSPNATVMMDELKFPVLYADWSNKKILEIGCGTGRHTQRLVEQSNTVVGIDLSEGMLSQAKKKLPEVNFIHADFFAYEFEKHSFEKILVSLVLEHMDDLNLFFQKVHDIVVPHGEILISDLHPERIANGSFARFQNSEGEEIHLSSTAHTESSIFKAIEDASLTVNFKKYIHGNRELITFNEKWDKYLNRPMLQFWSLSNSKSK